LARRIEIGKEKRERKSIDQLPGLGWRRGSFAVVVRRLAKGRGRQDVGADKAGDGRAEDQVEERFREKVPRGKL
jgi:hypothetical protein